MIALTKEYKKFHSATDRFLKPVMKQFFRQQLPKMFGPILLELLTEQLVQLINRFVLPTEHLRPGQILWSAVDKNTRPDSPKRRLVPVVLSIITEEDCTRLSQGTRMKMVREDAIGRICREAYQQGALLSMRDIAILTWHQDTLITQSRQGFERRAKTVLPHTGTLQDMGSCISHKVIIVRKVLLDKKDPRTVARETHHTLKAVDHYVRDFHRVKLCYEKHFSAEEISTSTGIAKHVVNEYINIIDSFSQN